MSASNDALPLSPDLKFKSYGTVAAIESRPTTSQASNQRSAAIERHESAGTSFPGNDVANSGVDIRNKPGSDEDGPMKYEAFCKLLGIKTEVNTGSDSGDLEAASGLYHTIRHNYMAASSRHYWFEFFVYSAFLAQVLLSANFIILGAVRGDHRVPIAILGAVSVSITGCLALIKGQGLPMRLRMERDNLWEVQLEAEELHWQIAAGKPVTFGDVKRIWSHYVQVKKDASLNHPDTWTSSANVAIAQPVAMLKYAAIPQQSPQAVTKDGPAGSGA